MQANAGIVSGLCLSFGLEAAVKKNSGAFT